MADLKFCASVNGQALLAATTKTVLIVTTPSNQRLKVKGWSISCDGTETTILATPADTVTKTPVQVEIITGTTAGTFTTVLSMGAAGAKTALNGATDTVQSIAKTDVTSEPTPTGIFDIATVPITGNMSRKFDNDQIPIVAGGDFVAIRCTSDNSVNIIATLICEE